MAQCNGITTAGQRCKIAVKEGEFCRYHVGQPSRRVQSHGGNLEMRARTSNSVDPLISGFLKLSVASRPQSGYLYIYTLDFGASNMLVYEPKHKTFKRIDVVTNAASPWERALSRLEPSSNNVVFVKVGYTAKQDPSRRLAEWKAKCKQSIHFMGAKESLNFKGSYYCKEKLAWSVSDPQKIESAVHAMLKEKYGVGSVKCLGCQSMHREWFRVPLKKLSKVFRLVDETVTNHQRCCHR